MQNPNLKLHKAPLGASYPDTTQAPAFSLSKMSLAMLPLTPVPFTGSGALYAWGRLIVYGGIAAYAISKKKKNLSIIFGSAAGLSVITSLTAKAWEDQK